MNPNISFQPLQIRSFSLGHVVQQFDLLWFSQVVIARHMIRDREWEVYRILLDEGVGFSLPRNKIEVSVRNILMGWDKSR